MLEIYNGITNLFNKKSMSKVHDYNLTNPEIMENPYEFYAAIHRDNTSLLKFLASAIGSDAWMISRASNTQVFQIAILMKAAQSLRV